MRSSPWWKTAIGCVLLLGSTTSHAQQAAPAPGSRPDAFGSPGIRVYSDKDGVRSGSIGALAFDTHGRLWIGTEVGPAFYDGKQWTSVHLPGPEASTWVSALVAGHDESMWMGMRTDGLWRYREEAPEHFTARSGLPSDRISCLARTAQPAGRTTLWVGTDGGLGRYREGAWKSYTARNSQLPDDNVTTLVASADAEGKDAVWVGTRNGLARLVEERWTVYRAGASPLPDSDVAGLLETKDGNAEPTLWVGTRSGGLARLHRATWTVFHTGNSGLPNNSVWSIHETRDASGRSTLWVGTYGGGLARLEDGVWTTFDDRNSDLLNNYILAMESSAENGAAPALWVGTGGGGLTRIRHGGWRALTRKHDNLPGQIWAFAETGPAASPSFWLAGQEGVYRFEQGQWSHFDSKSSPLPHDFVPALLESVDPDHAGALWAATQGGVALFERGQWKLVGTRATGLPSNGVRCLLETRDPQGRYGLWVGTSLGLARYQDGAWTTYSTENSALASNAIMSLLETTSAGGSRALWVGTMGGGLSRWEGGGWTTFTNANSPLPTNEVMSLAELKTARGARQLWVGTGAAGVARFDPDHPSGPWQVLSRKSQPALPDDVVYQARQDREGRVYLLTNRGVVRLTQSDRTRDDNEAWTVESFTVEDGLPSNEGNARAEYVDRAGRIWVGTISGAAVLDPANQQSPQSARRLLLSQARIAADGRKLAAGGSLAWNENTILFDYALPTLLREGETRYRTQLVGFDSSPSEWTSDGKSRYTNLPAGSYEFRIWARDYTGIVSGPVTLGFQVRPAPWRTLWAYALYALCALGAGYAISRARVRTLQRRTQVLEERVRDRTVELRGKNEELDRKNAELAEHLAEIKRAQELAEQRNVELARVNKELLESNYRADRIFSALADALPGTILDGKYRLDSRIGAGGFAVVFRGTHLLMDRSIAIKVFRPTAGNDSPRELERFRREAASACRVDHPNAIQVFDSGISEEGIAFMVMELLTGKTLAAALKQTPTMSLRRCVEIVVPVCSALEKAHGAGIIHRDIKPANVFLHQCDKGEVVKLVDFGIAKVIGADDQPDSTLTHTGNLLGTPLYMAPERFVSRIYDQRSDVFGVGVMLYRMISGRLPFEGDACELVIKMVVEEPLHLAKAAPHVPEKVADLVMRAMAKEIDRRPSARELGDQLQSAVEEAPVEVQLAVGLAPMRATQDGDTRVSDTARDRPEPTPTQS